MCVQTVQFISTRITEIEFQKNVLKQSLFYILYLLINMIQEHMTNAQCIRLVTIKIIMNIYIFII